MTTKTTQRQEQLSGEDAALANSARGILKSFLDKLEVLLREGSDMLVSMDEQLGDFDENTRRYEPTTAEKRR